MSEIGEEEAFLRGIETSRADDLLREVYADWLEERGEVDRGRYLRVELAINKLGYKISNLTDPNRPTWKKWIEEAKSLREQIGSHDPVWVVRVTRQLSIPSELSEVGLEVCGIIREHLISERRLHVDGHHFFRSPAQWNENSVSKAQDREVMVLVYSGTGLRELFEADTDGNTEAMDRFHQLLRSHGFVVRCRPGFAFVSRGERREV